LSLLENQYAKGCNYTAYRRCRYYYYVVVPHLARYLWWPPDRARLYRLEVDLYGLVLSYKFVRFKFFQTCSVAKEPYRVSLWQSRVPTDGLSSTSAKL